MSADTPESATLQEERSAGWDAAVDAACKKAMVVQDGFRKLLKSARAEPNELRKEHDISQGEAIVGTLGDVIRNIAALKGQCSK